VQVLLYSWVRLVVDGVDVSMSKRAGDFITLDALLAEVGVDAARWFFASRAYTSAIDFDIELAKKQSNENPVYYVQYAHARIASILRYAGEVDLSASDVQLLKHDAEQALIRKMLELPELVETMARTLEPHHLPHYAQELAASFHQFYTQCRVVTEDEALTKARLKLVLAAKTVLANALGLMGISAPEQM
jgi:arginyl-tRNA synthetase